MPNKQMACHVFACVAGKVLRWCPLLQNTACFLEVDHILNKLSCSVYSGTVAVMVLMCTVNTITVHIDHQDQL